MKKGKYKEKQTTIVSTRLDGRAHNGIRRGD